MLPFYTNTYLLHIDVLLSIEWNHFFCISIKTSRPVLFDVYTNLKNELKYEPLDVPPTTLNYKTKNKRRLHTCENLSRKRCKQEDIT